jgi:hypothetical protein
MFRSRSTLPSKPNPIPSSSDLCALYVSAFSSPNVDALDAASSVSPLSAALLPRAAAQGTKNTPGWMSVSIINPNFQFNRRLISNSHRITSFAYPHPLTPIESHLCKKTGGGVPTVSRPFPCDLAARRNADNFNLFMGLLHNSRIPRAGDYVRHSSLRNLSALCVSALSLFLLGFRLSTACPEPRKVDCSPRVKTKGQPSALNPTPRRLHNAHSPKMLKYSRT